VSLSSRRSVRRALAAATTTVAVLALAGCGGDDSDGASKSSAADSSDASASATGDASGDSGEESGSGEAPAAGTEISGAEFADLLEGALDKATTAHVTMALGGQGTAEGDADYTTTPAELAVTMDMAALGGQVEVRMVDGTIYLKSSALSGDQWIAFPLDDPNSPLGNLGAQLDPAAQFETFAAAVSTATFDGPQDLDGESLDHYTATVDTQKLLEQLPEAGQAGELPETMQQEWWFDDEGRIRQLTTGMGSLGEVAVSLDDWGTEVDIEAPPSDEVTSLPGTTS
jgi:hypothetical protein